MAGPEDRWISIDLGRQRLSLHQGDALLGEWSVSTALNGPGETRDSGCTPCGEHRIRIKIGEGLPVNAVLVGRRPTGEIYDEALASAQPGRDWILSRILWLTGTESGVNRGGDRDTLRRYIYIHGCPDSEPMGEPRSHGCVRMRNADVIALFDMVNAGTRVLIGGDGEVPDAPAG